MKKLLLFCLSSCLCGAALGQKAFFLYLQTDSQTPFYVRMSDKVYSSAVSGFLILPNLTDSTYSLNIGFPKSTSPETRFAVTINQNDNGYLIKDFEGSLVLFDMQKMNILKSSTSANESTIYETRTDRFSAILSKAADDPGLLKVAVVKKEDPVVVKAEEKNEPITTPEPKTELTDTVQSASLSTNNLENKKSEVEVVKTDTVVINTPTVTEQNGTLLQPDSNAVETTLYIPSVVTRRSESSTTEGFGVTYIDKYEGATDTIRILIPPSKNPFVESENDPKEKEQRFIPTAVINELVKANDSLIQVDEETKALNSQCKNIASEKDFMKLRKNMAAKDNDEAMIEEAKKNFKKKCFTTEQVRYLSTLFLSPASKYQFFDAIYEFTTYQKGFSSLKAEITDDYYSKRFKALIGE